MYTTKPLSLLKGHPRGESEAPPEAPKSGYLIMKGGNEDDKDEESSGWHPVKYVPFPPNRVFSLKCERMEGDGSRYIAFQELVMFVPVPDQPLASNLYYAIIATGKHKGLVRTCSREEDKIMCCFCCPIVKHVEPRPFDPADVYQQIIEYGGRGRFTARAVADVGIPYKNYGDTWEVQASKARILDVGEALGLDAALRSQQLAAAPPPVLRPPQLAGPALSSRQQAVAKLLDGFPIAAVKTVVGKWQCPFFVIKESGLEPAKQMDRGAFYEVTLEQRWELVHSKFVRHRGGTSKLTSKKALIGGRVAAGQEAAGMSPDDESFVWFSAASGERVGLCTSVWERMLWEENRGGWIDGEEDVGRVAPGWVLLVERFVFKRMNGGIVVAFDFVHLNKIRAKPV